MEISTSFICRILVVLLCAGIVVTSCEGADLLGGTNTEQGKGDDGGNSAGPLSWYLDKVTKVSATFTGTLDVTTSDLSFSRVTLCYSNAETFNVYDARKVSTTTFDTDKKFSIIVTGLKPDTKYNYCLIVEVKSEKTYSDVMDFTTESTPYTHQLDLNISAATDLSSSGSANCYIVSNTGTYKFRPVKGNSTTSVGSVASASILWEAFGSSTAPEKLDLISAFCYKDDYIAFKTADTFKEGNAVIAAKDADDKILWSWHIWFTDQPEEQVYFNKAGTMMDRNLGATSATPGDVGALGLLYQWGRKDPFLGSSSISSSMLAQSTIIWPSAVESNSNNGTIEYATAHPTTFITYNDSNYDWYYTGSSSTDNTRWTTSDKVTSIYDPCPAGWRVPDGGEDGVWAKALGSSSAIEDESLYNSVNEGINFSGKFGSNQIIWYPAPNYLSNDGGLRERGGCRGYYWSASSEGRYAWRLSILYLTHSSGVSSLYVGSSESSQRAEGCSVRCVRATN